MTSSTMDSVLNKPRMALTGKFKTIETMTNFLVKAGTDGKGSKGLG